MAEKTVADHEIVNHGIDHPSYFQGCGLAFTEYEDVATGIGDSPLEALEDALESLAQNGWDTDGIEAPSDWGPEFEPLPESDGDNGDCESPHYYVSVRVR